MTNNDSQSPPDSQLARSVDVMRSVTMDPAAVERVKRAALQLNVATHSDRHRGRWTGRALAWSSLVTAVAVVLFLVTRTPTSGWAAVIEAVAKTPWLLMTGPDPGTEGTTECWFSPTEQVIAVKRPDGAAFFDLQENFVDHYWKQQNAISRNRVRDQDQQSLNDHLRWLTDLMQGDVRVPPRNIKVYKRTERPITRDGKEHVEYRFVTSPHGKTPHQETAIIVDAETRLPVVFRTLSEDEWVEMPVSYPDTGPESIYDLGVARTAPRHDDRVSPDVEEIVQRLEEERGRVQRDCAVMVESTSTDPFENVLMVYRLWKQDTRWRLERVRTRPERPAGDTDYARWWHEHAGEAQIIPISVSDGKRVCDFAVVTAQEPDPENPQFLKIDSIAKKTYEPWSTGSPKPSVVPEPPEWRAYPALYSGMGTVVEKVNDSKAAGFGEPRPGLVGIDRYSRGPSHLFRIWLDPSKQFACVATATLLEADAEFTLEGSTDATEFVQTPAGAWLPAVIRSNAGSMQLPEAIRQNKQMLAHLKREGKIQDGRLLRQQYFQHFFYEFDSAIPEELFEVPTQ